MAHATSFKMLALSHVLHKRKGRSKLHVGSSLTAESQHYTKAMLATIGVQPDFHLGHIQTKHPQQESFLIPTTACASAS